MDYEKLYKDVIYKKDYNDVKLAGPISCVAIMVDHVQTDKDGEVYFESLITIKTGEVFRTYVNVEDFKKLYAAKKDFLSQKEN